MLRLDRAFLLILLGGACTDDSDPPSGNGTSDDDDDATDESTTTDVGTTTGTTTVDTDTTELDCPGVFDCVALCPDGDDPCVDACIARGSAEALELVSDVLACAEQNGCSDEACLAANCEAEVLACAGGDPTGGSGSTGDLECDPVGRPEMTGPITGLQASYLAGDPVDIAVPVDEDTARVSVGIYEVGSKLYLGGTAEDIAGPTTAQLSLFAGVVDGEVGTFYIAVELCSTTTCTSPFVRNSYQREDRTAPLADGETYVATREFVGGPAMTEMCPTDIPIQTFEIQ